MKPPRLAVSAIFHFEDEIFHITRQNHLRAFPGYTSFPGGKVDKEDLGEDQGTRLLCALKRELLEELGVELDLLSDQGVIKNIEKIAKATSPKFNPYIYETYFFLITLNTKISFEEDTSEIFESNWSKPLKIIEEFNLGQRLMIYPIRKVIEELGRNNFKINFIDFDEDRNELIPIIEPMKGFFQIMPDSNTLFPATKTNAFIIGDTTQVLIDPSPKDETICEELIKIIKTFSVKSILITHHHGDHHEFASKIARELSLPILISKDSFERCLGRFGVDYFDGVEIILAKEGDIITKWLGRNVTLFEVPGHDEGHLAIAPSSLEWFIVGDLFQGVGTVVVGGDEGDMSKYFRSLERIIELNPKSVTPSHGITLGGTNILQKTLRHRILREEQILDLFQQGMSNEKILKTIYFEIPEELYIYAMANIESHLKKLELDGKISL